MNRIQRLTFLVLGLILIAGFGTTNALAQRRSSDTGGGLAGPIEFSATYGSMWGGNISTFNGKLRTATGPSIGLALDIPLHPAMSLELSYTRQEGALNYDSRGVTSNLTDMSVNYWQIGAIRGLTTGKVRPFISTSLGAT